MFVFKDLSRDMHLRRTARLTVASAMLWIVTVSGAMVAAEDVPLTAFELWRTVSDGMVAATPSEPLVRDFGRKSGQPACVADALDSLDRAVAADIEVLFSYSLKRGKFFMLNGMGHVALRIRDTVYTIVGLGNPEMNTYFLAHLSLPEYLYGTDKIETRYLFGGQYGAAYARNIIGFRLRGNDSAALVRAQDEVARIEQGWQQGDVRFRLKRNNCSVVTYDLLTSAFPDFQIKNARILTPIVVADALIEYISANPEIEMDVVLYTQVNHARNRFGRSLYPLPLRRSFMFLKRNNMEETRFVSMANHIMAVPAGEMTLRHHIRQSGREIVSFNPE